MFSDMDLDKSKVLADRLMALLRERVKDHSDQELISYLDYLIPSFKITTEKGFELDDRKLVYQLADFLQYFDEEFVRISFLCIFKRKVDVLGFDTSLHALRYGNCSRIQLLGRLRYSEEGRKNGIEIGGLWIRYFLARVRKVPLIGKVLAPILNLDHVLRLDLEIEKQNADLFRYKRSINAAEHAISENYNELTTRLAALGDKLPKFDVRSGSITETQPERRMYLSEFTSLHGEDFVRSMFLAACGREPSDADIRTAMSHLSSGAKSKIILLGDLYSSDEAKGCPDDIVGLRTAYRSEKLCSIPLLGAVLRLPRAFRTLSHMNSILEYQSGEIAGCVRQVSEMEARIMAHYNNTLIHLKRELYQALTEHNIQK